jgi:hypothetical protein
MKVHYFTNELDFETAMETCAFEVDTYSKPEMIVNGIRNTMEDLAYRTALVFDVNHRPTLLYHMTTEGVKCRSVAGESYGTEGK